MLLLAEISDKMPIVGGTTAVAFSIAPIAFGFGLIWRWLVLLPMPVFIFYDSTLFGELQEPGFGQLVIDELGRTRVIGQFLGWNPPFAIACAVLLTIPTQRRGVSVPIC